MCSSVSVSAQVTLLPCVHEYRQGIASNDESWTGPLVSTTKLLNALGVPIWIQSGGTLLEPSILDNYPWPLKLNLEQWNLKISASDRVTWLLVCHCCHWPSSGTWLPFTKSINCGSQGPYRQGWLADLHHHVPFHGGNHPKGGLAVEDFLGSHNVNHNLDLGWSDIITCLRQWHTLVAITLRADSMGVWLLKSLSCLHA